jgi:hypothetical protein
MSTYGAQTTWRVRARAVARGQLALVRIAGVAGRLRARRRAVDAAILSRDEGGAEGEEERLGRAHDGWWW